VVIPVDLKFVPDNETVGIGDTLELNLWGDSRYSGQINIKSISLHLQWDPGCLEFSSYTDKIDGITGGGLLWWDAISLDQTSGTATIDGAVMTGSVQTSVNIYALDFKALSATDLTPTSITINGTIVMNPNNYSIAGNLGSAAITIVPEPATMCLLGLGALGLLRNRRFR
jgi:hypothetical protein